MDPEISQKVGGDPRLYAIEAYLTKKGGRSSEMKFLNHKKLEEYLIQTGTNQEKGLADSMVEKNKERFGSNTYKKKKTKSFFQILMNALSDQMLIILMVAAVIQIVVQFFFSDERQTFWLEGVSILLAVAVVSIVASVNDYQKQKQFQELNAIEESTNKFKGIRNGQTVEIHKNDVVVGDVLLVDGGSEFPADGIVLQSEEAVVDQGSITGQAIQKFKAPIDQCPPTGDDQSPSPVLVSGTSLTSGFVKMLILVVGPQSTAGKLNEQIFDQDNQQQTPLEIKLDKLVTKIGKLGVGTAILVFLALTIRLIISDLIPNGWSTQFVREVLRYLILAISIIVVAIPEGLPLAVTLSLAYSVRQMLDEKNLVRKLASCQTMGGAHVICTDKTGTLTQNEMFVVEVWNGKLQDSSQFKKSLEKMDNKTAILNSLALNTKAQLEPKPQGSSTELALIKFIRDAAPDFYKNYMTIRENKVLAMIPFNSDRKRMSTLIEENGKKILLHKGGVEIVIQACQTMQVNGQVQPINKQQVNKFVEQMAKKGNRVIALAYKQVRDLSEFPNLKNSKMTNSMDHSMSQSQQQQSMNQQPMQQSMKSQTSMKTSTKKKDKSGGVLNVQKSGFTLHMLIGIQDLPRTQTKAAIKSCHRGGVVVVMVTGDNRLTARAIADQVGITEPGQNLPGLVMEGKQIEQISPEDSPDKIEKFLRNLKVLARSRPEHKYRLVQCIQRLNNVVAVTGDGTNDAPALMKADVGFSMGVKGTQIAKSASDIIIMDDNFNSIVRALIWGRNIYESIRKFLQFQLTANVVACAISVISAIVIRQSVLTAIQMLWINMIMDSLASLALATEPPNGQELLDRRPFEKRQHLVTKTMFKHILGQSIFQVFVLLILTFFGQYIIPEYADGFDSVIGSDLGAKYYMGQPEGTVTSGMFYTLSGQDNYITYYQKYKVHSRHFTFIFNAFVMMQIFNFFNCRRIRDEHNILSNPCSNWLYWLIVVIIFVLQWVITTWLNVFFKMYKYHGLTIQQWMLAILFGAMVLLVSQILRFLPFWKPEERTEDERVPSAVNLQIKYRDQRPSDNDDIPAILNEEDDEQPNQNSNKFNDWRSVPDQSRPGQSRPSQSRQSQSRNPSIM